MFKRIMSLLLALTATTGASGQSADDRWLLASTPDHALIVRYRGVFPEWVSRKDWSSLVGITWRLKGKAAMPSKAESAQHYNFEEALQNAVEGAHVGVLAVIITGEGRVEWLYYTPSHDKFMAALNSALSGKPVLPLEISLEKDPDWSNYTDFSDKGDAK